MKKITFLLIFVCSFGFAQVGIGNVDPKTALDVTGALSLRQGSALALVNGVNNNANLGTTPSSFYRITGPTAAFSLSGIIPVTTSDGQIVTLENTTAFNFTIAHETATSTAANRIYCPGGTDLILSGQYSTVSLSYNATQARWIVIGSTDNPYGKNLQSAIGTSDIQINSATFADMTDMTITFTPKHNIVYVNFGASGDMPTNSAGSYVEFKILRNGTSVAGTVSLATDYDYWDMGSSSTGWNAHFTMYPVSVTAGVSTTIKIQWMRDGYAPRRAQNYVTTFPNYSHRNLTIYD